MSSQSRNRSVRPGSEKCGRGELLAEEPSEMDGDDAREAVEAAEDDEGSGFQASMVAVGGG